MTRKELEAYKVNERLIERNLKKIEEERYKDIPTVYGKVKSSMAEHPYIETHMAVQMEEPVESNKRIHKLEKWEQEVSKAKSDNAKVEEFINRIEDVKIKEIFIYRFIDGKSVKEIAGIIGCTNGRVSQVIKTIARVKRQINPKLEIEGILLTMMDYRTNYAKDISTAIYETYATNIPIFKSIVPMSVRAAETPIKGTSIFKHNPKGKVAQSYVKVTKEVLEHGNKREN